jgi:hypothetical protein
VKAWLLLPLLALLGCSSASPYVTTVGVLKPGSTLVVHVADATVNVYQPEVKQRRDLFTIAATALPKGPQAPAPQLRAIPRGILVSVPNALASLLIRVPDGTNLVLDSQRGDVNVTDIAGNAKIAARNGNVSVMLPGYAEATVGQGNLSVTMGATAWPGTLHFIVGRGDVDVHITGTAAFTAHLHTDDGTLFTEFGLRGTSSGASETIDGGVNGGGPRSVDVETRQGAIRLLRMQPQP